MNILNKNLNTRVLPASDYVEFQIDYLFPVNIILKGKKLNLIHNSKQLNLCTI